jgi:hypothetical protein
VVEQQVSILRAAGSIPAARSVNQFAPSDSGVTFSEMKTVEGENEQGQCAKEGTVDQGDRRPTWRLEVVEVRQREIEDFWLRTVGLP